MLSHFFLLSSIFFISIIFFFPTNLFANCNVGHGTWYGRTLELAPLGAQLRQ